MVLNAVFNNFSYSVVRWFESLIFDLSLRPSPPRSSDHQIGTLRRGFKASVQYFPPRIPPCIFDTEGTKTQMQKLRVLNQ